jgi:hypothetical protein
MQKGVAVKIAELSMTTREDAIIVDLAQDESGIVTGNMGACCSVVLLWGLTFLDGMTVRYLYARGHHAGGGPEELN